VFQFLIGILSTQGQCFYGIEKKLVSIPHRYSINKKEDLPDEEEIFGFNSS